MYASMRDVKQRTVATLVHLDEAQRELSEVLFELGMNPDGECISDMPLLAGQFVELATQLDVIKSRLAYLAGIE